MSKLVQMTTAVHEEAQKTCFMNATLQGVGKDVVVSIATFVKVPDKVIAGGENAVALWVRKRLTKAASEDLTFEVQTGPSIEKAESDDPLEEDAPPKEAKVRDKFIVYIAADDDETIVPDDHVYQCNDYMEAITTAVKLVSADYDTHDWSDAATRALLATILQLDKADMYYGRALYIIPWDGKELAVSVARRHDNSLR